MVAISAERHAAMMIPEIVEVEALEAAPRSDRHVMIVSGSSTMPVGGAWDVLHSDDLVDVIYGVAHRIADRKEAVRIASDYAAERGIRTVYVETGKIWRGPPKTGGNRAP